MTHMGDVGGGPPPADGLSTSERAELERLQVEVGQLQARTHGRAARAGRWSGATVMVVVAALLFGLSVVAVYVRTQLLDTDRYVATVAPLARDPLGPVPAFLRRWRRPIVVGVTALMVLILVLWQTPGIAGLIWLTVGVLLLLALVEIVARASAPRAAVPSPA